MTIVAPVCGRCDKMHVTVFGKPACKAHRTKVDTLGQPVPCKLPPARGLEVCLSHGGSSKNGRAISLRARQEYDSRVAAERVSAQLFNSPRKIDPAVGLIEEYWHCAGTISELRKVVGEIDRLDLVWGKEREEIKAVSLADDGISTPLDPSIETKTIYASRPSVWLKLLNEERDRYIKLGLEIVRLNLEARRDEYIRAQVDAFAAVLLDPEMSLTSEQRAVAAAKLRTLDGMRREIEGIGA